MNIKPINQNVIVEPIEAKKSKIAIPDSAKEDKPEQGKVVATDYEQVKVGKTILFKKYSPDEITLGGKKLLIISYKDIVAVIE